MSVTVVRGGLAESRHQVHVAVVDRDGALVASSGDHDRPTTLRSAAKAVQAQPLLDAGVPEAAGWDDAILAVCCASHVGADIHAETVRRGFRLAGVDPEHLRNCTGDLDARLRHNCSGNHLNFLALSAAKGWPLEGYRDAAHPSQQAALAAVAAATGRDPASIPTCVDGCGVVAFELSLREIAALYARLPHDFARQADAMRAHPELVSGEGEFDTVVMRAVPGAVAKGGAEALRAVALPDLGLGVAVRVEDGAFRAVDPAAADVLLQLLGEPGLRELEEFRRPPLLNASNDAVGELISEVRLVNRST
jgi:L-asparaginase II